MGTIGLLVAVAPFFGVILLGWAAARTRTISETGAKDISTFAFVFATPCLLFRTMASQPIDTLLDAGFVAAFLLAEAVVFVAVAILGWFVFRRSLAGCVVMGFGSSFTNALLLGLPMLLAIGGERAGAFVLLIVALDSMILLPLSMVAIELAKAIDQRTGRRQA